MTVQYTKSLLATLTYLKNDRISHAVYFLENESLIPRARNKCAKYALDNGFTDLFFVDADISWTPNQFSDVLDSSNSLVGAVYPIKALPLRLNFNASWWGPDRSPEAFYKVCGDAEELEVVHLATGFMRINMQVFRDLMSIVHCYDGNTYDFFPAGVAHGKYLSEDWAFCELAASVGHRPRIRTYMILPHTGSYHYGLDVTVPPKDD